MEGIPEWYRGRCVLVTGGTGFMGKVLLEKLLRCCPDVERVYVLCRAKRGQASQARINHIVKVPAFDKLRKEQPHLLKKLVAIDGDITLDSLGLKPENRKLLVEEVSVVFNGAASLRLEAGLKSAIENNTVGTKRVLELCREMKQIKAFIHLSTAFCHCEVDVLEERVYASPANPQDIMRAVQWMDETTLEMITPRLLGPHPNCYTYSKRLAESLVSEYANIIPCAIVRPSIVCPAFKEPLPGWVDSLNGPVGVSVAGGKGVIRSMLCHGENRAEVIPVDIAINAAISASWVRGTNSISKSEPTQVYNVSIGDVVPITWGEVLERGRKISYDVPFENILWYPNGTIRTNRLVHFLVVFFLQTMPAYLIDFLFFLARQKTFMVRVQNRIKVGMAVLQYFTMRNWYFKIAKARSLTNKMNERDREIFYLENCSYDIDEYLRTSMLGARQYCMKEPLSSIPRSRRNLIIYYWLDRVTKIALAVFVIWTLIGWMDSNGYALLQLHNLQSLPIIGSKIHQY
ncbi:putative fatty acyl-CoA reductase CG5065 [Nilaparvata lugens]|uniref:putative fatty acyl-CoA reductase CG5065 n=1 Tax=Nilaparvata lugens TaxID=108931 RepID=UPI00193D2953|nr:putative fatty acyl-CoA reductase CG5065 [Nilaparvata lugens]